MYRSLLILGTLLISVATTAGTFEPDSLHSPLLLLISVMLLVILVVHSYEEGNY